MKSTTPYLTLPGTGQEALAFYTNVFNGRIDGLQLFKDAPGTPPEHANRVMHARFYAEGIHFMVSDGKPEHDSQKQAANISLSLDCENAQEVDALHAKLSAGGTDTMPPQDTFWNARFAMCHDRFGVAWMMNFDY